MRSCETLVRAASITFTTFTDVRQKEIASTEVFYPECGELAILFKADAQALFVHASTKQTAAYCQEKKKKENKSPRDNMTR